jgi:hypothetical protein
LGPTSHDSSSLPEVLCVIQVNWNKSLKHNHCESQLYT